jgi:putative hydrolase of the HAD superfamily
MCVLFDLYNTLVYQRPGTTVKGRVSASLARSFAELGIAIPRDEIDEIERDVWRYSPLEPDGDATRLQRRLAAYLAGRYGKEVRPHDLRAAADGACATWDDALMVDPDAPSLVERLRDDHAIGLVTNFDHPPHVHSLLNRTGLDRLLDTVVISGEEEVEKPDPEIMGRACARLGVKTKDAVFVGDSIVDFRAADAAGMRFFWIYRGATYTPETERYRSSDDLLKGMARDGTIVLLSSLSDLERHL